MSCQKIIFFKYRGEKASAMKDLGKNAGKEKAEAENTEEGFWWAKYIGWKKLWGKRRG